MLRFTGHRTLTDADQELVKYHAHKYTEYVQMIGEDTEILATDPTQRDRILAELYSNLEMQEHSIEEMLSGKGTTEEYIWFVDEEIGKLRLPLTFRDQVFRLHYGWAVSMVYLQRVLLQDLFQSHPGLEHLVLARKRELMEDWHANQLPIIQQHNPPPLPSTSRSKGPATPPTASTSMLTPLPTHHHNQPKRVLDKDVEDFLNAPHMLIGRKFLHIPDREDADPGGVWLVTQFLVQMVEGQVESTYHAVFEMFGHAHIPMRAHEIRKLMAHSTYV